MANQEPTPGLEFEREMFELEAKIQRLSDEDASGNKETIRGLRRELADLTERVYSNLSAWETVLRSQG